MFSGIVEEMGAIGSLNKKQNLFILKIKAKKVARGTKIGDSISVNGICLTVTGIRDRVMSFDVMKETIDKTNLKYLKVKDKINLERALKVSDRIGGHFVSGHVDGVGTIKDIITLPNYVEIQAFLSKDLLKYIVPKGSVCIDGVSLTIGKVRKTYFSVYLIPHTLEVTTMGSYKKGDTVNIETDILAKYILNTGYKQ
jgi:riboflavin synthase